MLNSLFLRFHVSSLLPLCMFITAGTGPFLEIQTGGNQAPALPGEACQIAPLAGWTEQEQWVWAQVCAGDIADFNAADGYGGALDPKDPEDWPANRILRPDFLKTILMYEPYRSALTFKGVWIEGAWFEDGIDLSEATLDHPLLLHSSRFVSDVHLVRLRTPHLLSFIGSTFSSRLNMNSLQLARDLFMWDAQFAEVDLGSAQIGGQLNTGGSTFGGRLNMNSLHVEGSLFMGERATFADVDLGSAQIGGQLNTGGSTFGGKLNMNSLQVEGGLLMGERATFADVDLGSADIGGPLVMDGSTFGGRLDMNSLQVAGHLFMREAQFAEADLGSAQIGGQLNTAGSTFSGGLNMNSVQVEGSLLMGEGATFADVDLKSATVGGQLNMIGSTFNGLLDMDALQVESLLLMRNAHFAGVVLRGAGIRDQLDMGGSTFRGKLDMNSVQVASHLFMREKAEFDEVDLRSARIGGQLDMRGSTFHRVVDMNSLQVEHGLLMREGAQFAEVDLGSAQIGGQLSMTGSTFSGKLNMNSLEVESHLFMQEGARFAGVDLGSAEIGGQLVMDGSTFTGELNMDSMRVGSDLFVRNAEVNSLNEINMIFIEVGETFDISNARLPSLNLAGARIHGDFQLAFARSAAPPWPEGSKLILRNAEVGAIQDAPDAWPENLELEGFSYLRLGGFSDQTETDMATRDSSWFAGWLEKTGGYSPQPYEQLANTLRSAGRLEAANEVLYAGRNRELRESQGLRRLGLFLLRIFIGYGYRIHYALYWFFAFAALGALALRLSGQGRAHGMPFGIAYSLDMLLPIIRLRERHYDIDLTGWARYYFYVHILMGYVLASFLVAGLSGLTK